MNMNMGELGDMMEWYSERDDEIEFCPRCGDSLDEERGPFGTAYAKCPEHGRVTIEYTELPPGENSDPLGATSISDVFDAIGEFETMMDGLDDATREHAHTERDRDESRDDESGTSSGTARERINRLLGRN